MVFLVGIVGYNSNVWEYICHRYPPFCILLKAYVNKGTLKAIQNSGKDGSLRYTAAPHNLRLEKGSRGRNEM